MMGSIADLKEPIKEPQVIEWLCLNHDKKAPDTIADNSIAVSNAESLLSDLLITHRSASILKGFIYKTN